MKRVISNKYQEAKRATDSSKETNGNKHRCINSNECQIQQHSLKRSFTIDLMVGNEFLQQFLPKIYEYNHYTVHTTHQLLRNPILPENGR